MGAIVGFVIIVFVMAFGGAFVRELFVRRSTFAGKFMVVLFSPVLFAIGGAIALLGIVITIVAYLLPLASLGAGGYFIYTHQYFYVVLCAIGLLIGVLYLTWALSRK